VGTNHRDVIVGNAEPNLILGRGGGDIICGGKRGDRLEGGAGNDQLYGGRSEDTLVGGAGDDVEVTGVPAAEHTNTVLEGPGDDRIVLWAGDELDYVPAPTFTATAPPVDADLAQGTVTGQGDDRLVLPKDRWIAIFVPPGSTVRGTAGADVILGGSSTLFGGGGDDDFFGPGSDVHGNAGNDYVESGTTSDHFVAIHGGTGRDALVSTTVRPGDEVTLDGGPGARDSAEIEIALGAGQTTPFSVVDLDLASHLVVGSSIWSVTGFEDARLAVDDGVADTISVEGTDGANSLEIHAGLVPINVHALGGDDDVTTDEGDDTVDGGDGTDAADTAGGHDTCVSVEQPTNCETVTP
jgi:Ca2+-binding RTX toxin-like protein